LDFSGFMSSFWVAGAHSNGSARQLTPADLVD
jgi:hypothetical protein